MVLTASLSWYFIHDLLGSEKACFDTLAPDDSPIGCSTGLQLFVQVLLASFVSIVILVVLTISSKLLRVPQKSAVEKSVLFWGVIAVTLGVWHTISIKEEYGFLHGLQMGVGEITFPYLLALVFLWLVESKFKNITKSST